MWLSYHKEKWKLQKKRRDEKKRFLALDEGEGGDADHIQSGGRGVALGSGLSGMLRQQNRALIELGWEIIQVRTYVCVHACIGGVESGQSQRISICRTLNPV